MKKDENPKNEMGNSPLAITTTILEPNLLQCLVEKLASYKLDKSLKVKNTLSGWHTIETSSIEAYASGDVNLTEQKKNFKASFDSCFVFTCTKTKAVDYTLCWSCSLS